MAISYREIVYCAVDKNGDIQWVKGSSSKTRYFKTTKYLQKAVEYHNRYNGDKPWRVATFMLVEVCDHDILSFYGNGGET